MFTSNFVVLRGRLSSDPVVRDLPSGATVSQLELATICGGASVSVPVVVESGAVTVAAGDDVVVVGHVRRRFFRAGGVTQSRTEVVASEIHPAKRRRAIDRALARVHAFTEAEASRS